jgi:hypothetical protein
MTVDSQPGDDVRDRRSRPSRALVALWALAGVVLVAYLILPADRGWVPHGTVLVSFSRTRGLHLGEALAIAGFVYLSWFVFREPGSG